MAYLIYIIKAALIADWGKVIADDMAIIVDNMAIITFLVVIKLRQSGFS
jgi:hypothetical protein